MAKLKIENFGFKTLLVSGDSMAPKYRDGDWLLCSWWRDGLSSTLTHGLLGKSVLIQRGDPMAPVTDFRQIKRITAIESSEVGLPKFWVEGDNALSSTDSRQWGWLAPYEIKGTVITRYRRAKRDKRTNL